MLVLDHHRHPASYKKCRSTSHHHHPNLPFSIKSTATPFTRQVDMMMRGCKYVLKETLIESWSAQRRWVGGAVSRLRIARFANIEADSQFRVKITLFLLIKSSLLPHE